MGKWRNKLLCAGLAAILLACSSASLPAMGQDTNPGIPLTMDAPSGAPPPNSGWSKETKLKALNIGVLGGMMAYGLLFWDYGKNGFEFTNERWFQHDTKYGGADKLGHAISTYFAVQAFGSTYERWGYDRHHANLYGTLSAWSVFFMIEVADATSRYGFSYEDLIMDSLGAFTGYLRREYPEFEKRVDFRVEYWPSYAVTSGDDTDIASDYSGYKYLVALKGSGFDATSATWLQYLELQAGYYTRGFQPGDGDHYGDPHRVLYGALAVNLTHIFYKHNWNKTATFLHYYQVPYTYAPVEYNFDE
jgi:hypothetical protein